MTSDRPLVSVIVTSYNYAHYIGQTIASVLAQTYNNWELIIGDDGSIDNSLEVIRSFHDPRISVIASETNRGGATAYAEAYKLCQGKYFGSLDSDDYMEPSKLEKQVQFLEEHPDVDIVGTFVLEVDGNGQLIGDAGVHQQWFNQEIDLNQADNWLWQNHLCHSSALIRKTFHDRVGLTNADLPYTADYEFWVRCLIAGGRFHVLPEKLTYYRAHGSNVTHKNPRHSLMETAFIQTLLKPYLLKINRSDLVDKAIHLSHQQCRSRKVDENLTANILVQLLFCEDGTNFERFQEKLCSTERAEALVIGKAFDMFYEKFQSLEAHSNNLQKALAEKDAHISNVESHARNLERALTDKDAHIRDMEIHVGNLETHIGNVEAHARNLERALTDKDAHIRDMEIHVGNLETHIGNVEAHANNLQKALADKDAHINSVEAHAAHLTNVIVTKENQIQNLEARVTAIESTMVWRLVRKWYSFRHLLLGSK